MGLISNGSNDGYYFNTLAKGQVFSVYIRNSTAYYCVDGEVIEHKNLYD